AAGNLNHALVVRKVKEGFAGFTDASHPAQRRSPAPEVAVRGGRIAVRVKDTEQAHLVLGCRGLCREDERRFPLAVLNNIIGGGMSSRLFQQIREKRGLAYSVYSYTSNFADAGLFGVYAGCAPGKVDEVLGLTRDELDGIAGHI